MIAPELTAYGLHARRVGPAAWVYRPDAVGVARDARGLPSIALIDAGGDAFLNLTTLLRAAPDAVERLRDDLLAREGVPAAELTLTPLQLDVAPAELLVADGDGGWVTLARQITSGAPPFAAAFAVPLSPARVAAARAAFGGEPGHLAARYTVTEVTPRTREAAASSSSSYSFSSTTTTTRSGSTEETHETREAGETRHAGATASPPPVPTPPDPIVLLTDAAAWRTT